MLFRSVDAVRSENDAILVGASTVRLDNPGTFSLPATRVEAMYAPEMFGELPNQKLSVAAQEDAP